MRQNATFDAYLFQILKNKSKFIEQIMSGKEISERRLEDMDGVTLKFAEVMALCAGDPLIKERIELDVDVEKLKALKIEHMNQQYDLERQINQGIPQKITKIEKDIENFENDYEQIISLKDEPFSITVSGNKYYDKEQANEALIGVCHKCRSDTTYHAGNYKGFDLSVRYDSHYKEFNLYMRREESMIDYKIALMKTASTNFKNIDAELDKIPDYIRSGQESLKNLHSNLENAKASIGKPFPRDDELTAKQKRLMEISIILNKKSEEREDAANRDDQDMPEKEKGSITNRMKNAKEKKEALAAEKKKKGNKEVDELES